jgi:hypothetical protein
MTLSCKRFCRTPAHSRPLPHKTMKAVLQAQSLPCTQAARRHPCNGASSVLAHTRSCKDAIGRVSTINCMGGRSSVFTRSATNVSVALYPTALAGRGATATIRKKMTAERQCPHFAASL